MTLCMNIRFVVYYLVAEMYNQNYKPQEDGHQVLFTKPKQYFAHKRPLINNC